MNHEFIKFLAIGGLNTLIYYCLFGIFLFIGIDYRISVLMATVIGVGISFINFSKYVFKNENNKLIYRFVANYVVLYFLNIYLIQIIHNSLNYNFYLAGFIALFPISILTYFMNKIFVFKKKYER